MDLLNTLKFDDIVTFFNLHSYLNYYKLYNTSKYINSYHGYEHVKRLICSIHELTKSDFSLIKSEIRELMIAAIFHDFNYVGVDFTNPNYDHINIISAKEAFNNFCIFTNEGNEPFRKKIESYIVNTEYPICFSKSLSYHDKILLAADHSMIIYDGYNYMGLMFSVNECLITDLNQIINNAKKYILNASLPNEYFQSILDEHRSDIMCGFEEFVIKYKNFYYNFKFENLQNFKNKKIKPEINQFGFEFIRPNF